MAVFGVFAYFVGLEVKAPVAWIVVAAFSPLAFMVMLAHMVRMAVADGRTAFAREAIDLPRILRTLRISKGPLCSSWNRHVSSVKEPPCRYMPWSTSSKF